MVFNFNDIEEKIKLQIDSKRYIHTKGVESTAAALAMRYAYESGYITDMDNTQFINRARLAGILHDNAKCISDDGLLDMCRKNNIAITPAEERSPYLLHGKAGAWNATNIYGINDDEIIMAISNHTTGRPGMCLLEKIIFTADYIEPGRNRQNNLAYIRYLAFTDIDRCILNILDDTLIYLTEKKAAIDPVTLITRDYYKKIIEDR